MPIAFIHYVTLATSILDLGIPFLARQLVGNV